MRAMSCLRLVVIPIVMLLMMSSASIAQDTPWRFGPMLGVSLATPSSNVRDLPDAPSCLDSNARLDEVTGLVFSFAGEMAWRDATTTDFELAARISIGIASTTFATRETIGQASDADGRLEDVIVAYQTDVQLTELRFEPIVRWYARPAIALSLGGVVAIPLSTSFEQSERLVAPLQATYGDGATTRSMASGPLDAYAQAWYGVTASISYDIAIAERVVVRPEFGGVLALTRPMGEVDWHPHEVRAGVGIIFGGVGTSTPISPYRDSE